MKIAAIYCVFNEIDYLAYSLESIYPFADRILIAASKVSWRGSDIRSKKTLEIVRNFPDPKKKILVKEGIWKEATAERNFLVDWAKQLKMDYCWVIDSDEIYEDSIIHELFRTVKDYPNAVNFYCSWWTYWRSFYYRMDPPETAVFVVGKLIPSFKIVNVRQPTKGKTVRADCFLHHYSYAKKSERIKQKLRNIVGPGSPVRSDWFKKFDDWPKNKNIGDLHPF